MSAIVTVVLKGTLGFLVKKGRQSAAKKLKDGDVTDQQLRSWIVGEIDNVNSKLDAIARSDLGASISFFKEGLVFLNKVMDSQPSGDMSTVAAPVAAEMEDKKLEACLNVTEVVSAGLSAQALSLAEQLKKLDLTNLDELCKEALFDAKKRFDDARRKATEAFNNEALPPSDRILAMAVRLMATILEKVENPASVLAACRSGLEELHLMPFVRENFNVEITKGVKSKFKTDERRQVISSVCQLNRIIYDVALMAGEKEGLILWPCVEIGNEKVDPLRDSRVAKVSDRSVTLSFGQEGDEERKRLKSATSIATNTLGQFIVVDRWNDCVKVFDPTGTFFHSFGLPTEDQNLGGNEVNAVATDGDDNIYVLVNGYIIDGTPICDIYVFNKQASFLHKLFVGYEFYGYTVKEKNDYLLVPGGFMCSTEISAEAFKEEGNNTYVRVVRKKDGADIGSFSEKTLRMIEDITIIDDGSIMVLDKNSFIHVFAHITADNDDDVDHDGPYRPTSVSCYLRKFPVVPDACAIAFHWITGHVIIASQTPEGRSQVLFYSKKGELERSIDLELEKYDQITAATVTTNGRICVTTHSYYKNQKGKVLVL